MPPFGRIDLALEVIKRFRASNYGKQRLAEVNVVKG